MQDSARPDVADGYSNAAFWVRLGATVVDIFIVLFPFFTLVWFFKLLFGLDWGQRIGVTLGTVGILGYWIYFQASPWQATIGKRLFGLRVIREDGLLLDYPYSAKRTLLAGGWTLALSAICLFIGAPTAFFIMLLWLQMFVTVFLLWQGKKGVSIHDTLSKTRVVTGKTDE